MRALVALLAAWTATGCYHDKYGLYEPPKDEYVLPPDEARYNLPETATYRAAPKPKQEDTLMNRARGGPTGPIPPINGLGGL
ncbi:MAG: hypothetical protein RMJ56_14020 [Gemmataceae bacterium]|nr:hypothetical protein [Gemmata sp.]MDW8198709.1 hypothetical protein [Gemmataceae bacterium]